MSALTAARDTITARPAGGELLRIPIAAGAVIYLGGIVCDDADGYAVPGADAANYKTAGVAVEDTQDPTAAQDGKYDNSGGSDGDLEVVVLRSCRARYHLALRTPTASMRFARVYVYDDNTVAVHRWDVTHDVQCGYILRVPGDVSTGHRTVDLSSDEVEIAFAGQPFDWSGDVTTTTAAPTTTTTAQA